eukprot:TRINITY_DN1142_c0_g3_i3.p1 TRINITY_DN1142_c0_g3~~TRINITY_DN1142_c0_g3_i3.p1  ORF type:complete len:429 (-),score=115.95 TRINITY_DN1142_c0_g3_i3:39-1325(-)
MASLLERKLATSQPDTFETPDEVEQNNEIPNRVEESQDGEVFDRSNFETKEAFGKFASKAFSTGDKDFSDSIVKRRGKARTGGFLGKQKEFELAGEDDIKSETPLQKFHRLQNEVKSLIEEVGGKDSSQAVEQEITVQELTQQLLGLQAQLAQLSSSENAKNVLDPSHYIHHHSHLQSGLSQKLLAEIESITHTPQNGNSTNAAPSSSSSSQNPANSVITYELYYTPDQSKFMQANKVIDLERRLGELENIVGKSSTMASGSNPVTSLSQRTTALSEKLSLLDATKLDMIQHKMKALSIQLDPLIKATSQSTSSPGATQQSGEAKPASDKVREIFDTMNRWDPITSQLPTIISRLHSLRVLHEEAAQFSRNIGQLQLDQSEITALLKGAKTQVDSLGDNFKENMGVIQGNIAQMEERIATISKKLAEK